jgi:FSR family fosmidomycin resistance protein-like MFS transporter
MTLLFDGIFSSVAWGHFVVDMLNGQRPILLAYLSVSLGLTNTTLALISTIYVWVASISQIGFGWLTDRFGARWVAAIGVIWMGIFFSLAMTLPGYEALFFLVIGSLGSAALHPAGTMQATLRGRAHYAGRETTAASLFFFFGQFGYSVGPLLGGPLLDRFGSIGLLALAALTFPIGINAAWQMRNLPHPHHEAEKHKEQTAKITVSKSFIVILTLTASMQAWAQQNMITFVPKYLADMQVAPTIYGILSGLFLAGSALGGVIGGNLADRFGKKRVAFTALALASIPLGLIAQIGWSNWLYILIPLSGALTGSVHSILVVTAQKSIPAGMGLISGLTLGIMFSAGALGTLLSGPIVDAYGFPIMFMMTAGIAMLGAVFVLMWGKGVDLLYSS